MLSKFAFLFVVFGWTAVSYGGDYDPVGIDTKITFLEDLHIATGTEKYALGN